MHAAKCCYYRCASGKISSWSFQINCYLKRGKWQSVIHIKIISCVWLTYNRSTIYRQCYKPTSPTAVFKYLCTDFIQVKYFSSTGILATVKCTHRHFIRYYTLEDTGSPKSQKSRIFSTTSKYNNNGNTAYDITI